MFKGWGRRSGISMVFTASAASLPNQNRQNNMKTVIAWDLLAPSNQKIEVNKNA
jgi:hypothetical protein